MTRISLHTASKPMPLLLSRSGSSPRVLSRSCSGTSPRLPPKHLERPTSTLTFQFQEKKMSTPLLPIRKGAKPSRSLPLKEETYTTPLSLSRRMSILNLCSRSKRVSSRRTPLNLRRIKTMTRISLQKAPPCISSSLGRDQAHVSPPVPKVGQAHASLPNS